MIIVKLYNVTHLLIMLREKFEDRKRISRSRKWKDKQTITKKKPKKKLHKKLNNDPQDTTRRT